MTTRTQGVVLALLGAICLRMGASDLRLRFVKDWMQWPLLLTAVVLVVLAVRVVLVAHREDDEHPPAAAWLLLLPAVAVFVVQPPALGAYAAGRADVAVARDRHLAAVTRRDVVPMTISEYQSRAQWDQTLTGQRVALTGFVTREDGAWYVTRLTISCCAADAISYRARVDGAPTTLPIDTWVVVTGTWQRPPGDVPRLDVAIQASQVRRIPPPGQPYE